MLKRIAAIALLATSQAVSADDWDTVDFALLTAATTALVLDWGQTRRIARNPDEFYEKNTLLGDHPSTGDVDKHFAAALLGTIVIAEILPSYYRKTWLGVVTAVEVGFVQQNYQLGIKMDF